MNRSQLATSLDTESNWDIIIIGGGATGLGCAIDAASRGYKTLLLEKYDFAKGTSSRATKLIHGGVRYLAQGHIKLVREALKERKHILQNAPHICHEQAFIIPCYSHWQKWYYGFGMKMYDLLSGKWKLSSSRLISAKETRQLLPEIKTTGLKGGVVYYDGQFDDARLAIAMAQTAVDLGAVVLNYAEVKQFIVDKEKLIGLEFIDTINRKKYVCKAKSVINATGVEADQLMIKAGDHSTKVAASKGVHLVVDRDHFSSKQALLIPKTSDGRVLFAVPWLDKVVLGTTDNPVEKVDIEPQADSAEIDFILENFNNYAAVPISRSDVKSVFAGLRPLVSKEGVRNTATLNRHHAVLISKNGLVTITGGKWTTYRSMAEDAVNNAAYVGKLEKKRSITEDLRIHGYTEANQQGPLAIYGSDKKNLEMLMQENPESSNLLHPSYQYSAAQVVWAVRQEMAFTIEDFLARRIRLLFLDSRAAMDVAPLVAGIMQRELNETADWYQEQMNSFRELAIRYLPDK